MFLNPAPNVAAGPINSNLGTLILLLYWNMLVDTSNKYQSPIYRLDKYTICLRLFLQYFDELICKN